VRYTISRINTLKSLVFNVKKIGDLPYTTVPITVDPRTYKIKYNPNIFNTNNSNIESTQNRTEEFHINIKDIQLLYY